MFKYPQNSSAHDELNSRSIFERTAFAFLYALLESVTLKVLRAAL